MQFNSDNYAECDGVRSQSTHETNQKRSEPGMKQSRDRTRSMRRNQNNNFRFEGISPVESPVSIVGKSPCGQVDCLKDLDPNSKTEKCLTWTLTSFQIYTN